MGSSPSGLGPMFSSRLPPLARVSISSEINFAARFVVLVLRLVLPRRAHREAGFPGAFERHARHVLLGCLHGAARDDDVRLELPGQIAQALRFAVEEHHVDGAVAA